MKKNLLIPMNFNDQLKHALGSEWLPTTDLRLLNPKSWLEEPAGGTDIDQVLKYAAGTFEACVADRDYHRHLVLATDCEASVQTASIQALKAAGVTVSVIYMGNTDGQATLATLIREVSAIFIAPKTLRQLVKAFLATSSRTTTTRPSCYLLAVDCSGSMSGKFEGSLTRHGAVAKAIQAWVLALRQADVIKTLPKPTPARHRWQGRGQHA
jgi:Mg-chelatase subunit ChlD